MNSSKLGNWLQIVGNLGLLTGLVLVAFQIRQNSEITRTQLVHDSFLASQMMQLAFAGENPSKSWTKAIFEPESLTNEDLVVLDWIMRANWTRAMRIEAMENMGLQIFNPQAPAMVTVQEYLGNAFGKAWWDSGRRPEMAPRIEQVIRLEMAQRPDHDQHQKKRLEEIENLFMERRDGS